MILEGWDKPPEHLRAYNRVDIGLDTFPFNGATTTCEAMWMGVPVVVLEGVAYHGRAGVSILMNVGLKEFIGRTKEEYIGIAIKLASDIERLKELREKLRERMKGSPLMDAKRFTRNLERRYREIWRRWCEGE